MAGAILCDCASIEEPWFSAGLTFNQRGADDLNAGSTFLFAPDKIADVFTAVGVVPSVNLRFNPAVLRIGQSDGLTQSSRSMGFLSKHLLIFKVNATEPAAVVDVHRTYEDRVSVAKDDCSCLTQTPEFVRPVYLLFVWKLDRLGLSQSCTS